MYKLCKLRFTIDDRAVDSLDVKEFSFLGSACWVVLVMLFSRLDFGWLVCCFGGLVVGGSLRSICCGRSEWMLGGCFGAVIFLLAVSSSPLCVFGRVRSDLSDFALLCNDGVLGCAPLLGVVLGGPLLALDDEC